MGLNVCVFCASSDFLALSYFALAKELGEEMVRRGHGLVYGGAQVGLMGTVAKAVQSNGGHVVGVIPRRDDWAEVVYEEADDLIYTVTMRERKAIMAERADAFIALPGGIGTLEELLEIITLRSLGYHDKPVVILDNQDYYQPLLDMLERSIEQGFSRDTLRQHYYITSRIDDALNHIESPQANHPADPPLPSEEIEQ